jgi:hypothetical protein
LAIESVSTTDWVSITSTMEASTQLIRKPMRRVVRARHLLIVGFLFLMATSPSILFASISHQMTSLHKDVPNKAIDHSRSLVTSTKSTDTDSLYKKSSSTTVLSKVTGKNEQSCYAMYISKQDVGAAVPMEESPSIDSVDSVVNQFLREGSVQKGSSIILVTDDESVLHEIQQRPKTEYQWTVLHHKPSFINFLSTLTQMKQAARCNTVVSSNAKKCRFLLLLFGILKSTGRSFQSVHVNLWGTKGKPPKAAILHMMSRNPSLRKERKSEIGCRLCRYFSGNRQGFCDHWFH